MLNRDAVLVIEDNMFFSKVVTQMVRNLGYIPVQCTRFEDALEYADEQSVHLILTDIFMPGMGGIEGIRRIKEKYPNTKTIAMSGGFDDADAGKTLEAAIKVGADFVLKKPFTAEELREAMEALELMRARDDEPHTPQTHQDTQTVEEAITIEEVVKRDDVVRVNDKIRKLDKNGKDTFYPENLMRVIESVMMSKSGNPEFHLSLYHGFADYLDGLLGRVMFVSLDDECRQILSCIESEDPRAIWSAIQRDGWMKRLAWNILYHIVAHFRSFKRSQKTFMIYMERHMKPGEVASQRTLFITVFGTLLSPLTEALHDEEQKAWLFFLLGNDGLHTIEEVDENFKKWIHEN